MGLSDSLPGRPAVMYSHGALVASASARQGLPGSSADLSTRAVPNHPGRSDGCIRLLLRHRSCLASSKSGGLATFVFLSRPNRVHLRYGSRVRLASPPAPLLELAPARLRVEQAIYTMNSFQFIRSTRLLLAYPTSGRRTVRFLQQLPSPTRPTSIRTLLWSYCSGASWVFSIWNGRCRLGAELNVSVSSDVVPGACRSHPNSAICYLSFQAACFRSFRRF